MAILWSAETLSALEAQGIEPSLVQRALADPDEVAPGPPAVHTLRYWDTAQNREMWLRVRVATGDGGVTILGAEKQPVYPD